MQPDAAVSVLTVAFSVAAKAAMAHQAALNYRRKTTAGMSVPFFVAGMLSYDMWVLSGVLSGDVVLVAGQGPGAVLALVIAWQAFRYRKGRRVPGLVPAEDREARQG